MLHRASRLLGLLVRASDGDIGAVDDLYFDDERWAIRYLAVTTGAWLGRRVLISPMAVEHEWTDGALHTALTRDRVKSSPDAPLQAPVSRAEETVLLDHYGHPVYWGGAGLWGAYAAPAALLGAPPEPLAPPAVPGGAGQESADERSRSVDRRIRSISSVKGYHIHATDGEIGHVDDFLFDDHTWQITYLQLDTSNWIGGKTVAVSSKALHGVDAAARVVHVDISRAAVKQSPRLDDIPLPSSETAPPFVII